MSAFIVAIFPSVEDSLSKAIQGYPSGLKEAFGIGELSNVEQYLHAEMLSLIVPLAVGYLAVRAVASGLAGAAESGRLDVLLSAPLPRRRLCAAGFLATAVEVAGVLLLTAILALIGSVLAGAGLGARRGERRVRQRVAAGAALRRPRGAGLRALAAHQHRHRVGRRGRSSRCTCST